MIASLASSQKLKRNFNPNELACITLDNKFCFNTFLEALKKRVTTVLTYNEGQFHKKICVQRLTYYLILP